MLFALLKGFFTGASLIIAIGAQNTFVLQQGLRQERHLLVACVCIVIDVVLIFAGVVGLGVLIQQQPLLLDIARWGGAIFLSLYGLLSLRKAFTACRKTPLSMEGNFRRVSVATDGKGESLSVRQAILITASLSLLNPHVYLDTVILLGAIGGQLPGLGWLWFWLGASIASSIWFFALSLAAKRLAPWFAKPKSRQLMDIVIGIVMLVIALQLSRATFTS